MKVPLTVIVDDENGTRRTRRIVVVVGEAEVDDTGTCIEGVIADSALAKLITGDQRS